LRGLDTNVLVRYLTQDHAAQARRANEIVEGTSAAGLRLFISVVVLCELVWVLTGAYSFKKDRVVGTLEKILDTPQFEIGDRDIARRALDDYREGRGDFADYVIGRDGAAAGCDFTVTFDRRLKVSGLFRVIGPRPRRG
jgi:predicted nucleic-acid-binding protein